MEIRREEKKERMRDTTGRKEMRLDHFINYLFKKSGDERTRQTLKK